MNEQAQEFAEQSAAFQKIWFESVSKLMQTAFTFSPNSTPPEFMREIRNGLLEALSQSWNEFLRSPQFQRNMREWMDNTVAFREMSNDFMAKMRKEMQAPAREDIDTILLNLRHTERRILDRLETVCKQVAEANQQKEPTPAPTPAHAPAPAQVPPPAKKNKNGRGAK